MTAEPAEGGVSDAVAVVVTHRRPRLATQVVRSLLEVEGFSPERVLLVINGEGGLDDPVLERRISVLRLEENLGPAGGYRRGLIHVQRYVEASWLYLCEDDIGLVGLPTPRVSRLIALARQHDRSGRGPVGAIVAYGRDQNSRTGATTAHVPAPGSDDLEEVDVAAWGASLVSMAVLEAGVLPDEAMFFGFEDFEFWLHMRSAGFRLLADTVATRAVIGACSGPGRDRSFVTARPVDVHEPWRRYYEARNFFVLRKRYGNVGWTVAHLAMSARRMQLSSTRQHRMATIVGLVHGFLRRSGKHETFVRDVGEWS